jgi:glucose-6-phosphate isomerase, archaeal
MIDTHDAGITDPVALEIRAAEGRLVGSNGRYEKRLSELAGLYRDERAFAASLAGDSGDPVYWVESSDTQRGDGALITGISVLEPGRIGDEFFMTRGHLHARSECAETYVGLEGEGVMLLETVDGRSEAHPVRPGTAVYVPGGWVHRSVNVGTGRFSTLFVYPAVAGQDYDIIARAGGMRSLVVADVDGGWSVRDNPDHVGYRA